MKIYQIYPQTSSFCSISQRGTRKTDIRLCSHHSRTGAPWLSPPQWDLTVKALTFPHLKQFCSDLYTCKYWRTEKELNSLQKENTQTLQLLADTDLLTTILIYLIKSEKELQFTILVNLTLLLRCTYRSDLFSEQPRGKKKWRSEPNRIYEWKNIHMKKTQKNEKAGKFKENGKRQHLK